MYIDHISSADILKCISGGFMKPPTFVKVYFSTFGRRSKD